MKDVNVATKMLIVGETMIPFILCDEHAQAMQDLVAVPYTEYVFKEDEQHLCQACHLSAEQSRPKLLLPGEDF